MSGGLAPKPHVRYDKILSSYLILNTFWQLRKFREQQEPKVWEDKSEICAVSRADPIAGFRTFFGFESYLKGKCANSKVKKITSVY